ncbi:MAG: vitamin K epoxide reductase family protein [Gemmatimonadaceae bacterium]
MSNQPSHSHDGLLATLSIAGFVVATYLALYQLHVFDTVWEPLFGDGSRIILHSSVTRMLPVPDAALGAAGYLAEAICAIVRKRTPAWVGYVYFALVVVFFLGSLTLVAMQWGYFHAWCTLCLVSALISFAIAGIFARESREKREHERQS